MEAANTFGPNLEKLKGVQSHEINQHTKEFLWVGSACICRKKRKHYKAYSCNGVKISVHDFVYILAEEDKRLVAYLDDMYEDSKGNKMVVVRWFHKVDEVGLDSPHRYDDDREIFFSGCLQDLSIECIDGLATILSPQHYEIFLKTHKSTHTHLEPFVCQSQFDNEDLKPFDLTQVRGYWKQKIHSLMSLTTPKHCPKLQTVDDITKFEICDSDGIRPRKRLKETEPYETPITKTEDAYSSDLASNTQNRNLVEVSQIEVLSQDSGMRGCWFRATIVKKHKDMVKVRYEDMKDADDESVNLEEWISSSRIATPDRLGIRLSGRMTIRPARASNNLMFNASLTGVGSVVDAWLHDGWWEGIVVHKESDDKIHVYFPGEKQKLILGCKDLRFSEEWWGDRWIEMKPRPDVVKTLSSSIFDPEEDLLAHLNWNWSTKKRHDRKLQTRKHDGFDDDDAKWKFLFCPRLTSLIMSR